jgi:hypothetical protein
MVLSKIVRRSIGLTLLGFLVQGCAQMGAGSSGGSGSSTSASAPAPKKAPAWMNADGEVIDSKNVEAGYGQKVKGKDDWEGEITGKAAPGSKFSQLKIGMSRAEAYSIVGNPTDQGVYITGKTWIPFYFGSDRYRYEAAYKGMGRLIFAGSAGFDSNVHLIWIIHNKTDSGFR